MLTWPNWLPATSRGGWRARSGGGPWGSQGSARRG